LLHQQCLGLYFLQATQRAAIDPRLETASQVAVVSCVITLPNSAQLAVELSAGLVLGRQPFGAVQHSDTYTDGKKKHSCCDHGLTNKMCNKTVINA